MYVKYSYSTSNVFKIIYLEKYFNFWNWSEYVD